MKTWIPNPENILYIPGDEEETLNFAAQSFIRTCEKAIKERGAAFVALSGGSTPKAVFSRLKPTIDGKKIFLFWSDERCVPPESSESNYHMAMTSGPFKDWIPEEQIFRMKGEIDPKEAAAEYEATLRKLLPNGKFDLLLLGMGDDGHTASLFPDTAALEEKKAWVVANFVPKLNTYRITFTFPLIQRGLEKVIYLTGEKKAEKAKEVLIDQPGIFPSEKIGTEESPALWILDTAAASLLDEEFN